MGRQRLVRLSAEEFLWRWVQHGLPRGFVKIGHYGLLANRGRPERLAGLQTVAGLLGGAAEDAEAGRRICPACGSAVWAVVAERARPAAGAVTAGASAPVPDTS